MAARSLNVPADFFRAFVCNLQCRHISIKVSVLRPSGAFLSILSVQAGRIRAVGIVGIERKIEERRKETDKNISEVVLKRSSKYFLFIEYFHYKILGLLFSSQAFEDLSQLMVKVKNCFTFPFF